MVFALIALGFVALAVAAPLVAGSATRVRHRARSTRTPGEPVHRYDPGRERRAEQRARELLRSCVNDEEWAMYRDLGFLRVSGARPSGPPPLGEPAPYAYIIYPHKPIVAFVPADGRLLSEYCVEFPDMSGGGRTRLPASDDVLAKWMALTSDESRVLADANMHLVGRALDPARVRRDLWRLAEWESRYIGPSSAGAAG